MNPEQSAQRQSERVDFGHLDTHLLGYLSKRFRGATGVVAQTRTEVLNACLQAAEGKPGLYSLTVPTGGGKTLSSLAFALRHAARNGLRRVIYAIPFTSIIEQTAQTFREVFASASDGYDNLILEHHSNFDPEQETVRSRLASENWDSQLIVTTNVQLFESLFACRTSRCRKLHRIAGSVIILDEAQTLPIQFLEPCLKVLRLLVERYGCTVVLCTATQPAIEIRDDFTIGLPAVTPIIVNAPALYQRLKRVEVKDAGTLDCKQLAARLAASNQVLAIVSTRRHAADLFHSLVDMTAAEECFHLSAAMTPEHRSERLDEIRKRLQQGKNCRVVSTQLIEAGVDIDFPVVWRSIAGLDSIAQAAGRCNREGHLEQATAWVFTPDEKEHPIPPGYLRHSTDAARQVIATGKYADLLDLPAIEHYFRLHYWQQQSNWDMRKIIEQFQLANDRQLPLYFNFATVAERFRFIDSQQQPVIVARNEKYRILVERLRSIESAGLPPPRSIVRQLQRCTVTVNERAWRAALGRGDLQLLYDRFAVLAAPQLHYHDKLGLQLDADPLYDPNDTII